MNIFYLSHYPYLAAQWHCDAHVRKMVIEYAQLLSTAHRVLDGEMYYGRTTNNRKIKRWKMEDPKLEDGLMKASHVNHPSAVWARASYNNYKWLLDLWTELLKEYHYRYGKSHACEGYMELLSKFPKNIPSEYFTQPTPAMPDDVKDDCSIVSYRNYYIKYKQHLASWKNRVRPQWYGKELGLRTA